ncbi:hypothetical protein JST97_16900 [bacterium]|nr:hypothetical protein [bacterium]
MPDLSQLAEQLQTRERVLSQIKWDELSPEQCRGLRQQLENNQLQPQQYVEALEAALALPVPAHTEPGWLSLPGLRQREQRLFRNDFMTALERTRSGEAFALPGPDTNPDWDWFCGRHGVLRSPFIAPQAGCRDLFEKVRQAEAFAHLLTAVLEEHGLSQQWPVSLSEIPGYRPLSPMDLKQAQYEALGLNLKLSWREWSFQRPR